MMPATAARSILMRTDSNKTTAVAAAAATETAAAAASSASWLGMKDSLARCTGLKRKRPTLNNTTTRNSYNDIDRGEMRCLPGERHTPASTSKTYYCSGASAAGIPRVSILACCIWALVLHPAAVASSDGTTTSAAASAFASTTTHLRNRADAPYFAVDHDDDMDDKRIWRRTQNDSGERDVVPAPVAPPTAAQTPPDPPPPQPMAAPVTVPSPTVRPTFPFLTEQPTRKPTKSPTTRQPTLLPTKAPVTEAPTDRPTRGPVTAAPTIEPTTRPTGLPSKAPIVTTATEAPMLVSMLTRSPSFLSDMPAQVVPMNPAPSADMPSTLSPTKMPTAAPVTFSPTERNVTPAPVAPTAAAAPTLTASPTSSNIFDRDPGDDNNNSPSTSIWIVPIGFTADLLLNNATTLEDVESLWNSAFFAYLQSRYRQQPGVQVQTVNLTLQELLAEPSRRILQNNGDDGTIKIQSTGGADFGIDETVVEDPQAFVDEVEGDVDRLVTDTDFLQRSLDSQEDDDGTPPAQVSDIEATSPDGKGDSSEEKSKNGKPSTASIVIGFALLVITLLSLVFWARVLWKKRQKRLRRRRLEELRKSQTVTILPPRETTLAGRVRTSPRRPLPVQDTFSLESLSTYNGFASVSEEEERLTRHSDRNDDDDDDVGNDGDRYSLDDAFAMELQRAASLDRRAWEEFLLKKESIQEQKKLNSSSSTTPVINGGLSSGSSGGGIAAFRNVDVYDAPGSQEMGFEVEARGPTGSFPYGDENLQVTNPVPLTSQDAVQWTKDGISLASAYKSGPDKAKNETDNDFEPYGDRKLGRSLEQSWDLEEHPVKDEEGPSRFSFLFPLKRKNVQETQSSSADDCPTDAARRESPDVTSVDSTMYPTESESKEESLTELTNSMVKEVDEIANYLKLYEKRKIDLKSKQRVAQRARKSEKPTSSDGNGGMESFDNSRRRREQRPLAASQPVGPSERDPYQNPQEHSRSPDSRMISNASQSSPLQPRDVLSGQSSRSMDSTSIQNKQLNTENIHRQVASSRNVSVPSRVEPVSAYLSDSSSSVASIDDEESLRLGISRLSVEKPVAPNLSFRNEASPQKSSPYTTPFRLSPIFPHDESNLSVGSKGNSVLSALRQSPSILDAVPADEEQKAREGYQQGGVKKRRKREQAQPPIEQISTRRKKGISPRSNNETFNNIFSMFEEKPAAPIVPPNETWQYSGSHVGAGTKHPSDAVGRRSSPRFAGL